MDNDKALRNMFRAPNPLEVEIDNPRLKGKNKIRIKRWEFMSAKKVEEEENRKRQALIEEGVLSEEKEDGACKKCCKGCLDSCRS